MVHFTCKYESYIVSVTFNLFYSQNDTLGYLVAKGAPRNKLMVGIPFYGQSFTLANPNEHDIGSPSTGPGLPGEFTMQPGMLAYYEICDRGY